MKKTRVCQYCGAKIKFPDRRRGGRNMGLHFQKHHPNIVTPGMVRAAEIATEILRFFGVPPRAS
jgi:hypothetical protein